MGGGFNAAVMNGGKNLWGDPLMFFEPESEHSAATVCEGFAVAGGRVTNFTSGQGLVLMKEVLYTISGKRLPVVMNIGARALTSQGLNVHAGHDDVMSVADCGWGMLFGRNAQEAGDFCLIARRAAEASQTPFFNVQDGFLTTHTVETVRLPEPEFMKEYIGDPKEKLINLMDPANPLMSGVVQNQDSYMKGKIAQRWYYDRVEPAPGGGLRRVLPEDRPALRLRRAVPLRGRRVHPRRHGLLHGDGQGDGRLPAREGHRRRLPDRVRASGPSPPRSIVEALKNCKAFTVFERMDDPLSTTGNHLTREIKAAFCDAMTGQNGQEQIDRIPQIYNGAAGLGSRDVRPGDIIAAFDNMMQRRPGLLLRRHRPSPGPEARRGPRPAAPGRLLDARPLGRRLRLGHHQQGHRHHRRQRLRQGRAGLSQVRLGEEGPADHLLPDDRRHPHLHALRAGAGRPALHQRPDGACSAPDRSRDWLPGGAIFMQSPHDDPREVWKHIPEHNRRTIRTKKLRVYFADMVKIAREVASEADLQMRMQGIVLLGAFLKLTPYAAHSQMTDEQVYAGVEKALRKYFGKRGDRVVQDNLTCVKRGYGEMREIPVAVINA